MKEYEFAIVATSATKINVDSISEISDKLFEAGCEDGTVSSRNQSLIIEFYRESDSYESAVISAINEINSVTGLNVISVDAGDFVGLSDAAELSSLSRSMLSKLSTGERGDGNFPSAYLRLQNKAPLYDWFDIAKYLAGNGLVAPELAENAKVTSEINIALRIRNSEVNIENVLNKLK
ncbi:TPA: hypothetical protein ACX6PK_003733 [Photobacterium damselae]